jgi:hypothetical protein
MKRRQQIATVILAFVIISSGCGPLRNPATSQLSFEGQTAVAGRQFVSALRSSEDGIDTLVKADILKREDAIKVLDIIGEIGKQGQNLTVVLHTIDDAKDIAARQAGINQASAIIKRMQQGVLGVSVPVSTEAGRQKVAAIMATVSDALVGLTLQLQQPARLPAAA